MYDDIILTKLKYLDSKSIFEWLENDYYHNKFNYDSEIIENVLVQKNDNLK